MTDKAPKVPTMVYLIIVMSLIGAALIMLSACASRPRDPLLQKLECELHARTCI